MLFIQNFQITFRNAPLFVQLSEWWLHWQIKNKQIGQEKNAVAEVQPKGVNKDLSGFSILINQLSIPTVSVLLA